MPWLHGIPKTTFGQWLRPATYNRHLPSWIGWMPAISKDERSRSSLPVRSLRAAKKWGQTRLLHPISKSMSSSVFIPSTGTGDFGGGPVEYECGESACFFPRHQVNDFVVVAKLHSIRSEATQYGVRPSVVACPSDSGSVRIALGARQPQTCDSSMLPI